MEKFKDGDNEYYYLDILGLDYKVINNLKDHDKWGYCDHANQIIQIRKDYPPGKKTEILLHEILHAIFTILPPEEARGGAVDEETMITVLGRGLAAVLRNNPEFLDDELGTDD